MSTHSPDDFYSYKEVNVDQLRHEYEVTVNSQHIKKAIDSELKKIAKNAKLPGFRTGKAPYDLVVSNYKSEAIERVLNDTIEYCSDDLIKKNKMERYINPKVKIVSLPDLNAEDEKGNLVYQLSLDSSPEVTLAEVPLIDISKISLQTFKLQIEESDISEFIDNIKENLLNFIPVNDALYQAKDGDRLIIDFEGRIRGKIFKGGSHKNYIVELGSGKSIVNSFEDQLIGLKKGDTKTFRLQFPENYETRSIAGQEADFFVHVNNIEIKEKFENYDDLAKSMEFTDSTKLTEYAEEVIGSHCKKIIDMLVKKQLFEQLDTEYNFDLPASLIEIELQRVLEDKESEPEKEAKRRVKFTMLIMKFCTEHKFEVTNDDFMNAALEYYKEKQHESDQSVDFNKVIEFLQKSRDFQHLCQGRALEHKVTSYIIEKANKDQQNISVKSLTKLFDDTFSEASKLGEK